MNPPQQDFNYLRAWREARGLSLAEMGRRIGSHKSPLSRMETGKIPYHRDILIAYARVLGCQPGDLISRPPGLADELYRILAHCKPDELRQLEGIAKVLIEQHRQRNPTAADG